MGNPNLLSYETIVRATSGEPEAVDEVLRHCSKRIRIAAIENGHIDRDTADSIKQRLVTALFKFRFDEHEA
ncbi:helix-turn-helix domain-containing protein [Lachnospiraceae bacterium 47-T17]